jgi:hypothetical protein
MFHQLQPFFFFLGVGGGFAVTLYLAAEQSLETTYFLL